MPDYSGKAQPYLDAIAESLFTSQAVRDWLIAGTPVEANYTKSDVLIDEQPLDLVEHRRMSDVVVAAIHHTRCDDRKGRLALEHLADLDRGRVGAQQCRAARSVFPS